MSVIKCVGKNHLVNQIEYQTAAIDELKIKLEAQRSEGSYLQYATLSNIHKIEATLRLVQGDSTGAYKYARMSTNKSYKYFKSVLAENHEQKHIIEKTKKALIRRITFALSILLGAEEVWAHEKISIDMVQDILDSSSLVNKRYLSTRDIDNIIQVSLLECGSLFTIEMKRNSSYSEFINVRENFSSINNDIYFDFLSKIYAEIAKTCKRGQRSNRDNQQIVKYSDLAAEAEKNKGDIAGYYKFYSDKILHEVYQTKSIKIFWSKYGDLSDALNNYMQAEDNSGDAYRKQSLDLAFALVHGLELESNLDEKLYITNQIIQYFHSIRSRKHQLFRIYLEFLGLCKIAYKIKTTKGLNEFPIKETLVQANNDNEEEGFSDYVKKYFPDVVAAFDHTNELKCFINNLIKPGEKTYINDKVLSSSLVLHEKKYIDENISLHILKQIVPVILGSVKTPQTLSISTIDDTEISPDKKQHLNNISRGETKLVEFKSTLTWDLDNHRGSKEVLTSSMKTIAGFLNTDGGVLYIGVQDDGTIIGLDKEYNQIKSPIPKVRDNFIIKLTSNISKHLEQYSNMHISAYIETFDSKDICIIEVGMAQRPIYLNGDFYYRASASTEKLEGRQLVDYTTSRFSSQLK